VRFAQSDPSKIWKEDPGKTVQSVGPSGEGRSLGCVGGAGAESPRRKRKVTQSEKKGEIVMVRIPRAVSTEKIRYVPLEKKKGEDSYRKVSYLRGASLKKGKGDTIPQSSIFGEEK